MFYVFDQNNSGGYFVYDKFNAKYIIIEADSASQALELYYDVVYDDLCHYFCDCCGPRWPKYPIYEYDAINDFINVEISDFEIPVENKEYHSYLYLQNRQKLAYKA